MDEHAGVLQAEWILDHIRGQGLSRRPGRSAELDLREQPNRVRIISPAKRRLLHCHARTLAPDAPTTHLDLTYRRWVGCDPSDLLPENMSGTKTFSYGTGYCT